MTLSEEEQRGVPRKYDKKGTGMVIYREFCATVDNGVCECVCVCVLSSQILILNSYVPSCVHLTIVLGIIHLMSSILACACPNFPEIEFVYDFMHTMKRPCKLQ